MNKLIEEIFNNFEVSGVLIPVSFLRYDGSENTFITYQETDNDNSFSGDNKLLAYVTYYDFDIYSKKNYLNIIESVKEKLENEGFIWQPSRDSGDMYDDDTKFYHKTLCFAKPVYEEE